MLSLGDVLGTLGLGDPTIIRLRSILGHSIRTDRAHQPKRRCPRPLGIRNTVEPAPN